VECLCWGVRELVAHSTLWGPRLHTSLCHSTYNMCNSYMLLHLYVHSVPLTVPWAALGAVGRGREDTGVSEAGGGGAGARVRAGCVIPRLPHSGACQGDAVLKRVLALLCEGWSQRLVRGEGSRDVVRLHGDMEMGRGAGAGAGAGPRRFPGQLPPFLPSSWGTQSAQARVRRACVPYQARLPRAKPNRAFMGQVPDDGRRGKMEMVKTGRCDDAAESESNPSGGKVFARGNRQISPKSGTAAGAPESVQPSLLNARAFDSEALKGVP